MKKIYSILIFSALILFSAFMKEGLHAAEKELSVGFTLGYNRNVFTTDYRINQAYEGGIAGETRPGLSFGLRGKLDKKWMGIRLGLNYLRFMEQEDTSNINAATADPAEKYSGSGFILPVSFCINLISSEKSQFYLGYGFGYTSLSIKGNFPNNSALKIETGGFDWNFVIGGEVNIANKIGLFMELLFLRGGQNDASYSLTGSARNKIAISRNMEQFFIGVNYHLGNVL